MTVLENGHDDDNDNNDKYPVSICIACRHKASAPVKYMELEERLKEDSRVAYAYI